MGILNGTSRSRFSIVRIYLSRSKREVDHKENKLRACENQVGYRGSNSGAAKGLRYE